MKYGLVLIDCINTSIGLMEAIAATPAAGRATAALIYLLELCKKGDICA